MFFLKATLIEMVKQIFDSYTEMKDIKRGIVKYCVKVYHNILKD
jgi:hypothetical protein